MEANSINNREESLITIQDILHVLKSNIIAIVVMAIIGGVLMGGRTALTVKPTYKADARMYVLLSSDSSLLKLSELELSSQLTADYVEMMLSRPMLEEVIEELSIGDKYTPGSLAGCISIQNPEDTRILNITVITTDPQMAADIANTLADVSAKNLSDIMETSQPKVFQRAVVNYGKIGPNVARNVLEGIVLGAGLAIALAMFFFITDDTIKTEEDIERYAGLATFGSISDGPNSDKKYKNDGSYSGYGSYGGYGGYGDKR